MSIISAIARGAAKAEARQRSVAALSRGRVLPRELEHREAMAALRLARAARDLGKSEDTPKTVDGAASGENPYAFSSLGFPARREQDPAAWAQALILARGAIAPEDEAWRERQQWAWVGSSVRARRAPEAETVTHRAWRLRDMARDSHPHYSTARCGWDQCGETGIFRTSQGSHFVGGVHTCKSVWSCPVCAQKIKAGRADQIKNAVGAWRDRFGRETIFMATLTIRHEKGDALLALREGFQRALNRFFRYTPAEIKRENKVRRRLGLEARDWREDLGFAGYVHGSEVTVGARGWHYHRHPLLFFRRALSAEEQEWLKNALRMHWAECVRIVMGEKHEPSLERGFDFRRCELEDYIAKLGLEISDSGAKEGRKGNLSPWRLLELTARGNGWAAEKMTEYSRAMKGAKCIQFANNLLAALRELGVDASCDDAEFLEDERESLLIDEIPREIWREIRSRNGARRLLDSYDEGAPEPLPKTSEGWGTGARVAFELEAQVEARAKNEERRAIAEEAGGRMMTRREAREQARLRAKKAFAATAKAARDAANAGDHTPGEVLLREISSEFRSIQERKSWGLEPGDELFSFEE